MFNTSVFSTKYKRWNIIQYVMSTLFISFPLLFISCSTNYISKFYGSKYYDGDYSMTKEIAYSYTSDLTVKIPEGWFTSEDTECNCIDLWLIRKDFSATINLMRLNIDPLVSAEINENELLRLVELSKKLKQEKLGNNFIQTKEDEYFELNQNYFAAYEYQGDESLPIRVVVFKYMNKFFELSAMPANTVGKGKVDVKELFRVQQSIINSIQ